MTAPRVTVIMNCLNCGRYLEQAIDSVYAQTFADWEIVFWDNASSDSSAGIARRYDSRLRYFRSESTLVLGEARNAAIAQARGDIVTFLDCDDLWLPNKLESQVACFDRLPDVDFVYGNFVLLDEISGTRTVARPQQLPEGRVFEQFLDHYPVGMLTAAVRRKALELEPGPFDATFNLVEEYDLFMRILLRAQAAYLPEPSAVCRIHDSNTSMLHRGGWADEHRRVLAKFRTLDGAQNHTAALDRMAVKVEILAATIEMARFKLADARRSVAPYKWHSLKSMAIYCASFLPTSLWRLLKPLWQRGLFYR